uniref:Putative 40S ribosomal protein S8-like n=1 Tax=Davidia involucrata TaxID=16924 RepID=A0A5B7C4R8_DAVIN
MWFTMPRTMSLSEHKLWLKVQLFRWMLLPEEGEGTVEETKKSNHVLRKIEKRQEGRKLDPHIEEQFGSGRLLACISSRPGQCGRADGYILEGKELEFYMKKLQRKKGKGAGAAA